MCCSTHSQTHSFERYCFGFVFCVILSSIRLIDDFLPMLFFSACNVGPLPPKTGCPWSDSSASVASHPNPSLAGGSLPRICVNGTFLFSKAQPDHTKSSYEGVWFRGPRAPPPPRHPGVAPRPVDPRGGGGGGRLAAGEAAARERPAGARGGSPPIGLPNDQTLPRSDDNVPDYLFF